MEKQQFVIKLCINPKLVAKTQDQKNCTQAFMEAGTVVGPWKKQLRVDVKCFCAFLARVIDLKLHYGQTGVVRPHMDRLYFTDTSIVQRTSVQ